LFSPEQLGIITEVMRYLAVAFAMGFGAIGAAVGEGHTAGKTIEGAARQPKEFPGLFRTMLIGQAMAETAGIFALFIAIILIWVVDTTSFVGAIANLGGGLCVGVSGIATGIGMGYVSARACEGVARQPEVSDRMMLSMLLAQAMVTSAFMFAFLITVLLVFGGYKDSGGFVDIVTAAKYLGAGLSIGFGACGPALGVGLAGGEACRGIAANQAHSGLLTRTMFVGMAVSQSTAIYALVVSLILLYAV
jgi:ATP synthase F0 subunit c